MLPAAPAVTVKKPRVNNGRVRFLEQDELVKLFEKLPAYLKAVATFARFTGARRGEILKLTWNDIDFKRNTLTFRETKNGEDGRIVLNQTVTNLLKSLPAPIDRTQRVFQEVPLGAAGHMKLNRDWNAACRAARIGKACGCNQSTEDGKPDKKCRGCVGTGIVPDFRFHDLRHYAESRIMSSTRGRSLMGLRVGLEHSAYSRCPVPRPSGVAR